jgi:protein-tyrosine sulfotransferase
MTVPDFFVVGCQRSGTTLMRLILDSHPALTCHDEMVSHWLLNTNADRRRTSAGLVGYKVPQLTEQLHQPALVDDAACRSGCSQGIRNVYTGQPIVFLIRDVRDVVVSMLRLDGWVAKLGGTVLAAKVARERGFGERYREELAVCRRAGHADAVVAALIWRYKVDALYVYQQLRYPVLPVHYEDLVSRPRDVVQRVCEHVGVGWSDATLLHHEKEHTELDASGRAIGGTDARRPIDSHPVGRWRSTPYWSGVWDDIVGIAGEPFRRLYPESA